MRRLFSIVVVILIISALGIYGNNGTEELIHLIPYEAQMEDVSQPDHIIGNGTPESCTEEALRQAVASGGVIVFNGGSEPFTITLTEPLKVFNNQADVVIDGGGLVTLDGNHKTRILYMNTCDPDQVWTTSHCNNQDSPHLTVQNLHFTNGNSESEKTYTGGGAIFVRGGRFKVYNCLFTNNKCASTGPDVGGGAIRVFDQYNDLPVYIVNSTFGGQPGKGNSGSNGGAISSIGVSWSIYNTVFSYNQALGNGGNPAKAGTPGGGSGGAIYNDGNEMTLSLYGCEINNNQVNAYGSALFFVTNNHTGEIVMDNTYIENNVGGSWYPVYDQISMHSDTKVTQTFSQLSGSKTPKVSHIMIDGKDQTLQAYLFLGNHYYKLRDLAQLMNQSAKPFAVEWDGHVKRVKIDRMNQYKPIGTELALDYSEMQNEYFFDHIYMDVDGQLMGFDTYLIKGHYYFKLRDIAKVINFSVDWHYEEQMIVVDSYDGY